MSELSPEARHLRYDGVQVMRGVAAIMVVAHHFAQIVSDIPGHSLIVSTGLGLLGRSGVDIFFVISGFVMTVAYCRKPHGQASAFLFKRVLRITHFISFTPWWRRRPGAPA